MERLDRDHPVIKALHRAKPASVLVYERGKTEPRRIALSKGRNRWRALLDTLDAIAWEKVEGLDEGGATLCIVEPDDDDDGGDGGSLALVPSSAPPDRVDDVRDIVLIMRDVQRETLREARDIFSAQADATSRMLEAVTESMRTMREAYETAMRLQVANQATGGSDDDGIKTMLSMAQLFGPGMRPPAPPRPAPAPPTKPLQVKTP